MNELMNYKFYFSENFDVEKYLKLIDRLVSNIGSDNTIDEETKRIRIKILRGSRLAISRDEITNILLYGKNNPKERLDEKGNHLLLRGIIPTCKYLQDKSVYLSSLDTTSSEEEKLDSEFYLCSTIEDTMLLLKDYCHSKKIVEYFDLDRRRYSIEEYITFIDEYMHDTGEDVKDYKIAASCYTNTEKLVSSYIAKYNEIEKLLSSLLPSDKDIKANTLLVEKELIRLRQNDKLDDLTFNLATNMLEDLLKYYMNGLPLLIDLEEKREKTLLIA